MVMHHVASMPSKAAAAGRDDEDAKRDLGESNHVMARERHSTGTEEKASGQAETRFLDKRKRVRLGTCRQSGETRSHGDAGACK